ncbi:hypothetical protein AB0G05_21950 [Nonomuraea wenchangensis]
MRQAEQVLGEQRRRHQAAMRPSSSAMFAPRAARAARVAWVA